jgi:hypothetical protein
MGARTYQDIHTIGRNRVLIAGSFAPAAAGAPTAIRGAGIAGIVRTAQGVFTVTLMDVWNQCDTAKATLQLAAAAARSVQVGAINLALRTVVIRVVGRAGRGREREQPGQLRAGHAARQPGVLGGPS